MAAPLRSEFTSFLRERVPLWLAILVATLGGLAWLAWRTAQVPESPFTYQVM